MRPFVSPFRAPPFMAAGFPFRPSPFKARPCAWLPFCKPLLCSGKVSPPYGGSLYLFIFTFLYILFSAASLCVGSISLSFSSTPVKARRTPSFVCEFDEPLPALA